MTKLNLRLQSLSATLLVMLSAGHPVLADDTEVLIGPGGQAWAKPNVLFIMDTSTSMGKNLAGSAPTGGEESRLEIVQGVFEDLMNNTSYHGMNVALMRFDSGGHGGYFATPMQALNSSTKDDIIDASDALTANGNTPLSETLYEAARFYGGLSVDYGDSSDPGTNHADVFTGSNYDSPISSQCQANYVVLLTDGAPTSDNEANDNTRDDFLGGTSCTDNCLDEVAGYLHTTDQSSLDGDQFVDTYTIGFTSSQTLLQDTATAGGGEYIMANSEEELAIAFDDILDTITDTNDTFSPPALAANAFNGVSHHNRLYFALFEPAASPKWNGNVKPYALNDAYELVDANEPPLPAVDARGFFLDSSRSFWSSTADGDNIATGGANGKLPAAASRNLYTYTGGYDATTGRATGELDLTDDTNLLTDDNTGLTTELVGLPVIASPTAAETLAQTTARSEIISKTRDLTTIGAPLHSQPALVTYGGTEADPDLTLFVATNDGFLHAFDASDGDGEEQFAFIPQELLPNLSTITGTTGSHPYGLDGDVTTWVNDIDGDHDLSDTGDHVFVYVGMRRGGNNYYALDATDRNAPTLKWVIRGGAGGTPGFEELGQSWSKPTLATIKYATDTDPGTRKVLIFAGGYDTDQDDNPLDTDDDIGRAIFIVDADDGSLLWRASPNAGADLTMSELTNSIPSDVTLFDVELDGYTDRIYVGDMRGQIFRFDLQATTSGVSGTGVRLANLGGSTQADNRRFYYAPDIVFVPNSGTPYISLNIGSGYRAHPLNPINADGTPRARTNDRFYSLRDSNAYDPVPAGYTSLSNGNLFDATSSLVTSSTDIDSLAASNGWYITLGAGNGEKVLAPSITINGEIFFTTYTPPSSVARTDCAPPPGTGRLYRVSILNAAPIQHIPEGTDPSDIPTPTTDDRTSVLERPGIPSAPTIMYKRTGSGSSSSMEMVECVGVDCNNVPNPFQMMETYWKDDS